MVLILYKNAELKPICCC